MTRARRGRARVNGPRQGVRGASIVRDRQQAPQKSGFPPGDVFARGKLLGAEREGRVPRWREVGGAAFDESEGILSAAVRRGASRAWEEQGGAGEKGREHGWLFHRMQRVGTAPEAQR